RELQIEYNEEHDITPTTIRKAIRAGIETEVAARRVVRDAAHMSEAQRANMEYIRELEQDMRRAADELDFEEAARLRDQIFVLKGKTPIHQQLQKRRKRRGGKKPPWMPKPRPR
ncbi:MAG: hypothetical protein AMS16_02720, partial [Planctomycetes bacterium DG_58]